MSKSFQAFFQRINNLSRNLAKKSGEQTYLCYRDSKWRIFRKSVAPSWATIGAHLVYIYEPNGSRWS